MRLNATSCLHTKQRFTESKRDIHLVTNFWISISRLCFLQSRQVKRTPVYYINELIIWKLNPFVVPNNAFILKIKILYSRENLKEIGLEAFFLSRTWIRYFYKLYRIKKAETVLDNTIYNRVFAQLTFPAIDAMLKQVPIFGFPNKEHPLFAWSNQQSNFDLNIFKMNALFGTTNRFNFQIINSLI